MSQQHTTNQSEQAMPSHRRFAKYYERMSNSEAERRYMEPLRRKLIARASGLVLEVGVGNGLNFAIYDPAQVERVEAIEPDLAMMRYARERVQTAHVPITLTQATAEALPFADATFDSVVVTLVFCSVADPLKGLQEIRRVLKPEGKLLMLEHVRSHNRLAALVQSALLPLTTRFAGNCHWNRDTLQTVRDAAFHIDDTHDYRMPIAGGFLTPFILLEARNSPLDQNA
jgi:ubiquinone/menaquinone biosynthesis C-methylase UbiE